MRLVVTIGWMAVITVAAILAVYVAEVIIDGWKVLP